MKDKKIIILCFVVFMLLLFGYLFPTQNENQEYLRIHIRANSNAEVDQNVKYKVKDEIVNFLTPLIAEQKINTKEDAEKLISCNIENIEKVADKVLKANGFTYTSNAKLSSEEFPTRVYENLTLKSGYYDALILNLGSGEGDNWWCVIYPPLCFLDNTDYIYKSKILEIINSFKER